MSKYCDKCHVKVEKSLHNCPLCGNFLTVEENDEPVTPRSIVYAYPVVNNGIYLKRVFLKIMIFATIVGLLACTAVDFLVSGRLDWAYHVYVAVVAYWLTLGRAMFFKMEVHRQVMWDCIAAIGICFYIEAVTKTGASLWALHWATPGIIACGMFSLGALAAFDSLKWGNNIVTLTFLCFLSFLPMILSWFILHEIHWMLYTLAGLALVILIGVFVFGNKRYFLELKKRFHL